MLLLCALVFCFSSFFLLCSFPFVRARDSLSGAVKIHFQEDGRGCVFLHDPGENKKQVARVAFLLSSLVFF